MVPVLSQQKGSDIIHENNNPALDARSEGKKIQERFCPVVTYRAKENYFPKIEIWLQAL